MDRCGCNHRHSQHAEPHEGGCRECRCPVWHNNQQVVPALINEKWELALPEYRAYRPSWPWHEAARLAAMHSVIQPGYVVYEVGAEEGDYGALFASWGAQVVLAEPNPHVWPSIKASFEANGYEPYGWWLGFLSDHEWRVPSDPVERWSPGTWPDAAYGPLIPEHGFYAIWEHGEDTPALPLDKLADRVGAPPQVISIDVEGAELHVLRGAAKTLDEHRPVVFVSVHPEFMRDQYDLDSAEVYDFMAAHGYQRTFLAIDHEVHEMFRHPEGR